MEGELKDLSIRFRAWLLDNDDWATKHFAFTIAAHVADRCLEVMLEEAGIRKDELAIQDRDSARGLAKDKGIYVQAGLSIVFIGGFFVLMYLFFANGALDGITDFAKGQLGVLIGVITAAVPQILAFWFGSSRGSKEKTSAMAAAINGAT